MVKGWNTNEKGTYYFDLVTGAMVKGMCTIDGIPCAFDTTTAVSYTHLISNNDGMGMAMFNSWSQENGVPTFGYDANADAVAAIADG